MNNKLFVYGTLLNDIHSMIANHLKTHSKLIGDGTVNGLLFDLGSYPGLVYQPETDRLVFGQVFELDDPEEVLATLDGYEGINLNSLAESEYSRLLVPVSLDKDNLECWVYVYNGKTGGLKQIESGNYLEYINNLDRPDHWSFIDSV